MMGFLESMVGSIVQDDKTKSLLLALLGSLVAGTSARSGGAPSSGNPHVPAAEDGPGNLLGGLGGLLERFQKGGYGSVIDSWIGNGPNQPVSPGQLGSVLGSGLIKTLAERAGVSEEDLVRQLSQMLPGVVDKLTPHGRLPTAAELSQPR